MKKRMYPKIHIGKSKNRIGSLWVYYTGEWTPRLDAATKRFPNEGSGCCTDGFADASFTVKNWETALKAARKIARLPTVGRVVVNREASEEKEFIGPLWKKRKRGGTLMHGMVGEKKSKAYGKKRSRYALSGEQAIALNEALKKYERKIAKKGKRGKKYGGKKKRVW